VHQDTIGRHVAECSVVDSSILTSNELSQRLSPVRDFIESPIELSLLPSNLLLHGSKETLRVEETGQPEGLGSFLLHPVEHLVVSVNHGLDPR